MIAAEPVDNEIRVLGVEAVQNQDGQVMNVRRPEGGRAATVRTDRMQQVRELKQQGMTADQIASEIGVSRATAYRMVKEVQ